jgi:hypothetical protein
MSSYGNYPNPQNYDMSNLFHKESLKINFPEIYKTNNMTSYQRLKDENAELKEEIHRLTILEQKTTNNFEY